MLCRGMLKLSHRILAEACHLRRRKQGRSKNSVKPFTWELLNWFRYRYGYGGARNRTQRANASYDHGPSIQGKKCGRTNFVLYEYTSTTVTARTCTSGRLATVNTRLQVDM